MGESERFGMIERLLLSRRSVSFAELMAKLEISRATLHRDLAKLRDRMGVPIIYDWELRGYRIDRDVDRQELSGVWFSAGEIHALLSMQQLLQSFDAGGVLAEHIEPLRQRLLQMLESTPASATDLSRRVRIISIAARACTPRHFQTLATALMERRRLQLVYRARSDGQRSSREVSPLRLVHYRGNWYLDAWCHLRDELRSFAVDALEEAEALPSQAEDIPDAELDAQLGAGYGIFAGPETTWATLRFSPERARWVAAEQWHPLQEGCFFPDGSYQLRLPYSRDPELVMDILKYGPDCQVLEPIGLRAKVLRLLRESIERYDSVSCPETDAG